MKQSFQKPFPYLQQFKAWTDKYDTWSLLNDFFFLFGVLVLDWSPVLLILYFMIDTVAMAFFALILFYKERNGIVYTLGFIFVLAITLIFMIALYNSILDFIESLVKSKLINVKPQLIINPVVMPIILSFSILNHQSEYSRELDRMKKGIYKSSFIKHYFLRYFLINAIIIVMVCSTIYYDTGIFVALIGVKSVLRLVNKKYREIL